MYSNICNVTESFKLDKDYILSKFTEEEIFAKYLGYYPKVGNKYKSPFTEERTPSFMLYVRKGNLLFKCFSSGKSGDVFNFVGEYIGASRFIDVLIHIHKNMKPGTYISMPARTKDIEYGVQINVVTNKGFTEKELLYWKQFNISEKILNKFNVYSCSEVWVNKRLRTKYIETNPVYGYQINGKWKIYKPFEKKKELKWISNTTSDKCIQGFFELEYKQPIIFITSSLKDVMSLYSMGYESIAMSSENAYIPAKLITYLKMRYKKVIIFYNNDEAGIKAAIRYSDVHDLDYIHTPTELKDHKDPSDYIKRSGVKNLKQFIESSIK